MRRPVSQTQRPDPVRVWAQRLLAVAFWLAVWALAAKALDQQILLVSPARAVSRLLELMRTAAFYHSLVFSLSRILLGFLGALAAGTLLAALSHRFSLLKALAAPLMSAVKSTPVASIIILALIWIRSSNLSVFTSFLMGLPVFYTNVLKGLESADPRLLEMAYVFEVPLPGRIRAIYVPAAYPFFLGAVSSSFGMCWKAGVAAEVIGIPTGSVGEALYRAKVYLNTPDLFAWTIAIMLISVLLEQGILLVIRKLQKTY